MTMKQKLFFGLIALAAAAPELVSRRAESIPATPAPKAAAHSTQNTPAEGIALARRGSDLHEKAQYREAVARFDSAAQKIPALKDWLNAFAASSLSHVGDTAEVQRRL